jgi:sugar phosphate isomerase/epimerase
MASRIIPGLVSITFRALQPSEIVNLAVECNLRSIEWGGDVHVPHGDVATAQRVRRLCDDAGIDVSAYGSYYRLASQPDQGPSFQAVMDCAIALRTSTIRVWAGNMASADANAAHRSAVAADLVRIANMAAARDIRIGLEYHGGTLTDTPESTLALLQAALQPNVQSFWQPRHGLSIEQNLAEIELLQPRLANAHVFHWWPNPAKRLPLVEGRDRWARYLSALKPATDQPRHASLEFTREDDPQQLRADAGTLLALLQQTT